jgi:DNA polymerase III delta prime subunit
MIDNVKYDPNTPKCVEDIIGNGDIWLETYNAIKNNTASNMVLAGPPGVGKSLFLKLALAGHPVLSIECTANSGLRDVRDSIRVFARGTCNGKLRWIIFERADALTSDTQAFLRRMLETTVNSTRFIFECRDAGVISEPILSRATIVSVSAPDNTEIIYEIIRRTGITREIATDITQMSYGNMRSAIINSLAVKYCNATCKKNIINEYLKDRPEKGNSVEWMKWAVNTEIKCRDNGIDLRDILRIGWKDSPVVNNTCIMWSRLGGTSPRTLFFDCIARVEKLI